MKIQVFEPPTCCSVDPALVQFSADLEWIQSRGVEVQRFTLSQQPDAFVKTTIVSDALSKEGNGCLPLILIDGAVASKGSYPTREMLAGFAKIAPQAEARKAAPTPCCCGPSPRAQAATNKRGSGCC